MGLWEAITQHRLQLVEVTLALWLINNHRDNTNHSTHTGAAAEQAQLHPTEAPLALLLQLEA